MGEGVDTGNTTTVNWQVLDDVGPLAAATERPHHEVQSGTIDRFQEDGVVLLSGLFREWVDPLAAGLDRVLQSPHEYAFPCDSTDTDEPGRFFDCYCNWQRIPEWLTFVMTSAAASVAGQLMRSTSAQFFHEHAFAKAAGTAKATPWHHDLPYYCVDGLQTCSIYIALDPTPAETAVRFLRSSHVDGNTYRPRTFRNGAEYMSDPEYLSVPQIGDDADDVFVAALEPGDCLAFDFRTLHGTTAAVTASNRRAFSTRWLGDDVRYVERKGATSPPLVDLGVAPGQRMPETMFPLLWTAP